MLVGVDQVLEQGQQVVLLVQEERPALTQEQLLLPVAAAVDLLVLVVQEVWLVLAETSLSQAVVEVAVTIKLVAALVLVEAKASSVEAAVQHQVLQLVWLIPEQLILAVAAVAVAAMLFLQLSLVAAVALELIQSFKSMRRVLQLLMQSVLLERLVPQVRQA